MVGELLKRDYVRAGHLAAKGGFSDWDLTAEEALRRIEREWMELGRDPNIADICWFSNTERGDALASARHGERP